MQKKDYFNHIKYTINCIRQVFLNFFISETPSHQGNFFETPNFNQKIKME